MIEEIRNLGYECGGRRVGPALIGQAILGTHYCYQRNGILIVVTPSFPDEHLTRVVQQIICDADREVISLAAFDDQEDIEDHNGEYPEAADPDITL